MKQGLLFHRLKVLGYGTPVDQRVKCPTTVSRTKQMPFFPSLMTQRWAHRSQRTRLFGNFSYSTASFIQSLISRQLLLTVASNLGNLGNPGVEFWAKANNFAAQEAPYD